MPFKHFNALLKASVCELYYTLDREKRHRLLIFVKRSFTSLPSIDQHAVYEACFCFNVSPFHSRSRAEGSRVCNVYLNLFMHVFLLIQKLVFKQTKFNYTYNERFCNATFCPLQDERNLRAIEFWVRKELPSLFIKISSTVNNNSFELFSYSIDCCKWERYRRRNVFTRIWTDNMQENINIKIECPFKKGFVRLEEREALVVQNSIMFIPNFLKSRNIATFTFKLELVTKENRKLVNVFEVYEEWSLKAVQ